MGSRKSIARLTRVTITAAIRAMSSAPPTALATIGASTFMTLLPFPSTSLTPHDSGSVNALGAKDGSSGPPKLGWGSKLAG
jgi:hypothetical protein